MVHSYAHAAPRVASRPKLATAPVVTAAPAAAFTPPLLRPSASPAQPNQRAVPAKPGPPRGSLLEQLAQSQAKSSSLISEMNATFKSRRDRSGMLLILTTRALQVGTCEHRFAGTARFFEAHVVYAFDHPRHRQVEMHMRYEDMASPAARVGGKTFAFRINWKLEYFDREYDFTDPAHALTMEFLSDDDARKFRQLVLPLVQGVSLAVGEGGGPMRRPSGGGVVVGLGAAGRTTGGLGASRSRPGVQMRSSAGRLPRSIVT